MRTGLGRTGHTPVLVVWKSAVHKDILLVISARSRHIHPVSIIGVIRCLVVRRYRCDRYAFLVSGRVIVTEGRVPGRKYHDTSGHRTDLIPILVHSCILNEVVNGFPIRFRNGSDSRIFVAPAVLSNHGSMIRRPFHGLGATTAGIALKYLTGHQLYSRYAPGIIASSYSTDSYTVVIDCGNSTGHMSTVILRNNGEIVVDEIITVDLVTRFIRVMPHVGRQILMVIVNAAIDDSHDNILASDGDVFPYGNDIDISSWS